MAEDSSKNGKSESPKVRKVRSRKPKVGGPESEEGNTSAFDFPQSELIKSEPDSYRDEHPTAEIKPMEVHHHPEVEKKSFKQYLLEGLMIFLAVFMGFIAENIRENIAEHEHETQYMESLVRDLALDTISMKAGFPVKEKRLEAIDSVFLFFESHAEPKTIPFDVYRNIKRTLWDRIYTRNTGTINQLKNAGGLRLIRKTNVRDSLATYDWLWERLNYYKDTYYTYQQQEDAMVEKMVNAADLLKSYRLNNSGMAQYPSLSKSSVIRINTAGLSEYLNFLGRQKITTTQDEQNYKRLEGKAVALIKIIKKEYNLE